MVVTEEIDMRKHVLALTASAVISAFSVLGAIAQAQGPATPSPGSQQGTAGNQDGGSMMGPRGMMGFGGGIMHREGIMGREGMGGGGQGGMAPMMMRMMFSLMDADGDGKLSLQEFQAAHERIFKALDTNKDGFVTFDEMQTFIRGTSTPQR
jgi:EF hand domain-containing protein